MTRTCVYVHIYLDPDVYLSLDGVVIPNHGYVLINDIDLMGLVLLYSVILTDLLPLKCRLILEETGYHQLTSEWVL